MKNHKMIKNNKLKIKLIKYLIMKHLSPQELHNNNSKNLVLVVEIEKYHKIHLRIIKKIKTIQTQQEI